MTRSLGWRAAVGVSVLAGSVSIALPAWAAGAVTPAHEPQRARILKDHVEPFTTLAFLQPYAGAVVGGFCVAGGAALAVVDLDSAHDARWPAVGVAAGCAAAGFASYLAPLDYQAPIVAASLTTGFAAEWILLTHFSEYATPAIRISMFSFAGGVAAPGLLGLLDAALRPPLSSVRLKAHERVLGSRGDTLTRAELAQMEADLELFSNRPVPRWTYGAATLTSGVVAFVPLFLEDTSKGDKKVALGTGLLLSGLGAASLAGALLSQNVGYSGYVKALRTVDLTPIGPEGSTGVWALGRF